MLSCGSLRNFKESGGVGAKKSMERWSREVKLGYLYLPIWGKKSHKRFSEAVPNFLFVFVFIQKRSQRESVLYLFS
jgi:hypothetical protein